MVRTHRYGFCVLILSMNKKALTILNILLLVLMLSTAVTYAAGPSEITVGGASSARGTDTCTGDDGISKLLCAQSLPDLLNALFKISLSVGAVLALLRIAYSGYLYMGSADMWSTKSHAKEVLADAVIGLILLLAIWLILNQINFR